MKTLRSLASFPLALVSSSIAWIVVRKVLPSHRIGFGFLDSVVGLAPLVLATALPAFVFVVVGARVAPSTKRWPAFLFFVLSFFFSLGGVEIVEALRSAMPAFWLTGYLGTLVGATGGIIAALRFQQRPNQSLEPTRGAVTPHAP
jgi:hypothetical protein